MILLILDWEFPVCKPSCLYEGKSESKIDDIVDSRLGISIDFPSRSWGISRQMWLKLMQFFLPRLVAMSAMCG